MALSTITATDGRTYLQLPQFDSLSNCLDEYRKNKTLQNEQNYFNSFHAFLQFIINYANSTIGNNLLSDKEIAEAIFVKSDESERGVYAHLSALKKYAEFLATTSKVSPMMKNADDIVFMLLTDCEHLFQYTEFKLYGTKTYSRYYSRNDESPRDIFWAINQLFSLPQSVSTGYINVRDVQPITAFLIRQFIETSIFNALGVEWIENNGKPAHGQISPTLNFFCDTAMHTGFSIQQPLDKECLMAIYNWTNDYIHNGIFTQYYVTFFAWTYINTLITPTQNPIQIYTGKRSWSFMHGDIQITNYNTMKAVYEHHISPNGKFTIHWLPEEQVGAYILSL